MKAQKDPDLTDLLASDNRGNAMMWAVSRIVLETIDVLAGSRPSFVGHPPGRNGHGKDRWAAIDRSGKHDEQCEPHDAKQGRVYGIVLIEGPAKKDTLVVSR